jgi:glutamate synthase domain-containing protein 3
VREAEDKALLKELISRHAGYTGSKKAKTVLERWDDFMPKFVKIVPIEYRKVLEARKVAAQKVQSSQKASPVHG